MSSFNDLLRNYDVEVPEEKPAPADETPPPVPPRKPVHTGKSKGAAPAREPIKTKEAVPPPRAESTGASAAAAAAAPVRHMTDADEPGTPGAVRPVGPDRPSAPGGVRRSVPGTTKEEASRPAGMLGVFGTKPDEDAPPKRIGAGSETKRTRRFDRPPRTSILDRLPPLWGVDLTLILLTIVGVFLILKNIHVILFAVAKAVLSLVRVLFWIALILGAVLVIVLSFRRRRYGRHRGWW